MTTPNTSRNFWIWLAIGVVLFIFLFLIRSILLPFVLGMMIAYFLDPAADYLERKRFSRTSSTAMIVIGFFGVLAIILITVAPMVYDQMIGLLDALPGYIQSLQVQLAPHIERVMLLISSHPQEDATQALSSASSSVFPVVQKFVVGIFTSGMAVVNAVTLLFLTPVVAFYMLRDWDRIVAKIDELLPRQSALVIREQMAKIDETISAYLRGQVNVCFALSVYYVLALGLLKLKFFLIVGLVGGLLAFVPFVGAMSSFLAAMLIGWFQFGDVTSLAIICGIYAFGQVLEGNILVPNLVGDKIGVHPVWVIFGMLAGATLFGFVGILLAVPVTAIIGVLVRFAIERYRGSELYSQEPPAPAKSRKGKKADTGAKA